MFYSSALSEVLVNGRASESCKIEKEVRQGCALSSVLCVIAFDVMLEEIYEGARVKPILLPNRGQDKVLLAYADDLSAIVPDEDSVEGLLFVLETSGKETGAKINIQKKQAVMFRGDSADEKHWYFGHVRG